jgi:hypothetical protein
MPAPVRKRELELELDGSPRSGIRLPYRPNHACSGRLPFPADNGTIRTRVMEDVERWMSARPPWQI